MATQLPGPISPFDTIDYLNAVSLQIRRTFNRLIAQLVLRKEALLLKVARIRDEYQRREDSRKERHQMAPSPPSTQLDIPEKALTKLPHFQHHTFRTLQNMIKTFGEVSMCEIPNFSEKIRPLLAIGGNGYKIREFKYPRAIAIDEANENLFIGDCGNGRIQILSFVGNFISQFGMGVLKWPWGIGVTKDKIFVTDIILHALLTFDRNNFQLISTVGGYGGGNGQLNNPRGLSFDMNGDVYIADSVNNRVSVFTELLTFVHCFGDGQLKEPQDVKLTLKCVVVLDTSPNCVRFFLRNGNFLHSCVSQGDLCQVWNPFFFCIDSHQNIIISDYNHHAIKIFSINGEIVHTIGCKGQEKGEFISPYGIALSCSGVLFIVSENLNYALQAF